MTRRTFVLPSGFSVGRLDTVTVCTDVACTVAADIQTLAGAAIAGGVLTARSDGYYVTGRHILGPDNVVTLYAKMTTDNVVRTLTAVEEGGTDERTQAEADAQRAVDVGTYGAFNAWKHKPTQALLRNLAQGLRSTTIVVMGDSTGDATNEWPYLTAAWLAARYPAYTVDYRLYDDVADGWGALTRLQTGTAGLASFDGGTTDTRGFTAPDTAGVSIVGDLSVRVKLSRASWTSASAGEMFNKFGASGQRSWRFIANTDGTLTFNHNSDGIAEKAANSSAAVPFANGATGWVRADLDVDNGASGWTVTFYTSTDGVAWTQLGTPQTTAVITSVFDSTTGLSVVNRGGTSGGGIYYAAELYSGIGANPVLRAAWHAGQMYLSSAAAGGVISGYDVCGNLWSGNLPAQVQGITGAPVLTVRNASVPGMAIDYFNDATRFAKIHTGRIRATFVSLSHNEGGAYFAGGDTYRAPMVAFITQIQTASPDTAVILVGQNPKVSPEPTDKIRLHADRIRQVCEIAATNNHGFVDAYTPLSANVATYVGPDGIHPTVAGSALWATTTQAFLVNA